jgi:hypothetical protein
MRGVLMARRGRKRQLGTESEYWQLLLSGIGTVEACRAVGIGRKTGYRWRAENGGLPPVRLAESARSGRYLSLLERQRILFGRTSRLCQHVFLLADGVRVIVSAFTSTS